MLSDDGPMEVFHWGGLLGVIVAWIAHTRAARGVADRSRARVDRRRAKRSRVEAGSVGAAPVLPVRPGSPSRPATREEPSAPQGPQDW